MTNHEKTGFICAVVGAGVIALTFGLGIGHADHDGELAKQDLAEWRNAFGDGQRKYSDGYAEGYDKGMKDADAGGAYSRGYGEGYTRAYLEGYHDGKNVRPGFDWSISSDYPYTHLMTGANVNMKLDPGGCIVGPFEAKSQDGAYDYIITAGGRWPAGCDQHQPIVVQHSASANIWCDAANKMHIEGDLPHFDKSVRVNIDCVTQPAVGETTTVYPQNSFR